MNLGFQRLRSRSRGLTDLENCHANDFVNAKSHAREKHLLAWVALCHDFPFLQEVVGGSFEIWQISGWFCMRIQLFLLYQTPRAPRADTVSRKATFLFIPCCFVSGAKISSFYEFYLFLIAVFLSHCVGSLCPSSVFFFKRCLRLKASSLFCLKCVYTSRIAFSLNLVPLQTTGSKNIVSVNFGGEFN